LALTATATEQVKFDVIRKLGSEQCYYFQSSFNRANLFYSVKDKGKKLKEQIVDICRKYSGQSGIIYCMSKKDCEKVSEMLNKEKIVTAYYHADLKNEKKKEVQENWMNN
jgi:superfamily II DNA helicase RecQ